MDRKREQGLIQAAQRGDTEAFSELYCAYVDHIYRYIYYRVNVTSVAEDLTADVFVSMLESLANYEDRSKPLLAWLYRIAYARVVDYYRRARHTDNQQDIEDVQLGVEHDMDEPLMTAHQISKLQKALPRLTPEQQQVVFLRFIEGNSLEETADLIGKSIGAVKLLQHRALRSLSQALGRKRDGMD